MVDQNDIERTLSAINERFEENGYPASKMYVLYDGFYEIYLTTSEREIELRLFQCRNIEEALSYLSGYSQAQYSFIQKESNQ